MPESARYLARVAGGQGGRPGGHGPRSAASPPRRRPPSTPRPFWRGVPPARPLHLRRRAAVDDLRPRRLRVDPVRARTSSPRTSASRASILPDRDRADLRHPALDPDVVVHARPVRAQAAAGLGLPRPAR